MVSDLFLRNIGGNKKQIKKNAKILRVTWFSRFIKQKKKTKTKIRIKPLLTR